MWTTRVTHSSCRVCTVDTDRIAAFLIVSNSRTDVLRQSTVKKIERHCAISIFVHQQMLSTCHKFTVNLKWIHGEVVKGVFHWFKTCLKKDKETCWLCWLEFDWSCLCYVLFVFSIFEKKKKLKTVNFLYSIIWKVTASNVNSLMCVTLKRVGGVGWRGSLVLEEDCLHSSHQRLKPNRAV